MAAGGGKPRCGVDIDGVEVLAGGKGGSDLLEEGLEGSDAPEEATAGEKREVDGGVGGV